VNKILLTGSTGFVGKNILKSGVLNEFSVLAPSSSKLNLLDKTSVKNYFKKNSPDFIIHSAGKVGGILKNINSNYDFLLDNSLMAINLISESLDSGVTNFMNISSSCIYPRDYDNPIKEKDLLSGKIEPTNEGYALAKILALKLVNHIHNYNNLNYKTIIPCNLYGPYDNFDPMSSHMIPGVIQKIHHAKHTNQASVEIWGDGTSKREFMYIKDFTDFIGFSIKNFDLLPEILNVGTGKDYSIEEYYQIISNVIDYKVKFTYDLSKPTGMKRKLLDVSKAKKLGWKSNYTINSGIRETYKYFKKNYDK
jgi:GDP-L-fucose synthase